MNDKILKFDYKDTDKIIEIDLYGLVFEINNLNDIGELEGLDKNDKVTLEAQIESLLGQGAIEKINKKREEDGYKKLDANIELGILGCILKAYSKGMTNNFADKIEEAGNEMNGDLNRFNNYNQNYNREQRRNHNHNYNRRNYRRY